MQHIAPLTKGNETDRGFGESVILLLLLLKSFLTPVRF